MHSLRHVLRASRVQILWWCLNYATKDAYNIYYLILRYPQLSGSFLVSLPIFFDKLGFLCRIFIHVCVVETGTRFLFSLRFWKGFTFRHNTILFTIRDKMGIKCFWFIIFLRIRFFIRIITNSSCSVSPYAINHWSDYTSI